MTKMYIYDQWWKCQMCVLDSIFFLQLRCSWGCYTNTCVISELIIKSFTKTSFLKISSEHLHSQAKRAREQRFWEKGHLPLTVTCHVSHVMFHKSRVTCHMSRRAPADQETSLTDSGFTRPGSGVKVLSLHCGSWPGKSPGLAETVLAGSRKRFLVLFGNT